MADILTRLAALTAKNDFPYLFPIHLGSDGRKAYILRALIAPHEKWAQRNHSQSLQRLAERGGLGWCEALAVLENRRWSRDEAAQAKVLRLWHEWQEKRDASLVALVQDAAGEIERLRKALKANDCLIRDIRHRDARWHDDQLVKQILDANKQILSPQEPTS
jgi:hypothetical protein